MTMAKGRRIVKAGHRKEKSCFDKSDYVTGCKLEGSPRIVNNHAGCVHYYHCGRVQIVQPERQGYGYAGASIYNPQYFK